MVFDPYLYWFTWTCINPAITVLNSLRKIIIITFSVFCLQSDRFFTALKGHGALCRLVILPYESHGYSARESIMHVLWETDRWLQKYCEANSDGDRSSNEDRSQNSTTATDNENNKALSATGGGAAHESSESGEALYTPRSLLW